MWLGKWVVHLRKNKNRLKTSGVHGNQILRLERIGMRWDEDMQKAEEKTAVAV